MADSQMLGLDNLNFGNMGAGLGNIFNKAIIVIPLIIFALLFLLWLRKTRKLTIPVVEVINLGKGKFGLKKHKAGIFRKKVYFGMLFWTGDKTYRLGNSDIIFGFRTDYYQEINGKKGIVCYRDPLNKHILVPIDTANFKNTELLAAIAPVNIKDTSLDALRAVDQETSMWSDKVLQAVVLIVLILGAFIFLAFVSQQSNKQISDAKQFYMDSQGKCQEACSVVATTACREAILYARTGNIGGVTAP